MSSYLEGINKCVSYIESNLMEKITMEDISKYTYYSYPQMHRVFSSLVGDSIGNYIRKRRLTKAAGDLIMTDTPIIELALKYGFASQQTFTRAFHDVFAKSPKKFREEGRLENMYEQFQVNEEDLKRLPTVEITIERVPAFQVASFHITSNDIKQREKLISKTWNHLIEWQMTYEYKKKNGVDCTIPKKSTLGHFMVENNLHVAPNTKYFGFNNPFPETETKYGYEAWAMLPAVNEQVVHSMEQQDIMIKNFEGGLYATAHATYGENSNLADVWKYMHYWLAKHEEYTYGENQWLEEHETTKDVGGFHGFKLYLPIQMK